MILPNQLTILRIILTPVFVFFFITPGYFHKEIALIIFLVAALTDWYDGWLARKFNYITAWGKFWDPMADKILTGAAFICFVILDLLPLWMVVLILVRDFVITMLRGQADRKGKSFTTSKYAKWKTTIQMAFLYYILLFYVLGQNADVGGEYPELFAALLDTDLIYFAFLGVTIITVHSGIVYLYKNRELIKELVKAK